MTQALLREDQAHAYVGDMPDKTFDRYFGDHVIKLGKRNYYRPKDLDEIVDGLAHGEQPETGK